MASSKKNLEKTRKLYEDRGYDVGYVEQLIQMVGWRKPGQEWTPTRRRDLFGFADMIAMGDHDTIAIQVTSWGGVPSHVQGILENPKAKRWVSGFGRRLVVIGWRKTGHRFEHRLKELTYEDFPRKVYQWESE